MTFVLRRLGVNFSYLHSAGDQIQDLMHAGLVVYRYTASPNLASFLFSCSPPFISFLPFSLCLCPRLTPCPSFSLQGHMPSRCSRNKFSHLWFLIFDSVNVGLCSGSSVLGRSSQEGCFRPHLYSLWSTRA